MHNLGDCITLILRCCYYVVDLITHSLPPPRLCTWHFWRFVVVDFDYVDYRLLPLPYLTPPLPHAWDHNTCHPHHHHLLLTRTFENTVLVLRFQALKLWNAWFGSTRRALPVRCTCTACRAATLPTRCAALFFPPAPARFLPPVYLHSHKTAALCGSFRGTVRLTHTRLTFTTPLPPPLVRYITTLPFICTRTAFAAHCGLVGSTVRLCWRYLAARTPRTHAACSAHARSNAPLLCNA